MRWKSCSKTMAVLAALLGLAAYGAAATETVLYNFQGGNDGNEPFGVIMVNGKLYGTAAQGGAYNLGTVFELVHTKSGWAEKTLHSFAGGLGGWNPIVNLVADRSGNIYGAAGQSGGGFVFEMSPDSGGERRFEVIYAFREYGPSALTVDDAGTLFGVTASGGGSGCVHDLGCGTVFELSAAGHGKWKLTTLHRFDGKDGFNPEAPMYRDAHGNLYGTTEGGGGRGCEGTLGCGTVFELSPSGSGWRFAVLHRFNELDGESPSGMLAMDSSGSLYGTAQIAYSGFGLVFELTPGGRRWKETILHQFSGNPDGEGPVGGVVLGGDWKMYGTTTQGGSSDVGAIFKIERSAKGWKESVPFSFDGSDGDDPVSMTSGGSGKYYGTTWDGGNGPCPGGCGVVFEFVP